MGLEKIYIKNHVFMRYKSAACGCAGEKRAPEKLAECVESVAISLRAVMKR